MSLLDPSALDELHTARDWIRWGASRFNEAGLVFGHGTEEAMEEATGLVLHALHLPHGVPDELLRGRLTRGERQAVLELLRRRVEERIPAPYLTHEAWFAGLPFYVDERVLVPRSPIAELIQGGFAPWLDGVAVDRILDLCTGSGCIAIACAHVFPEAQVEASDLSAEALQVARINVERHGLEGRVHLWQADLWSGLPVRRYPLIVSNPPYVDLAEMAALPLEYRREPALGLAAGEDGLAVVRRILDQAARWLTPDGLLVVEVGASQPALLAAYPQLPFLWPELRHGGEGVFLLPAAALREGLESGG